VRCPLWSPLIGCRTWQPIGATEPPQSTSSALSRAPLLPSPVAGRRACSCRHAAAWMCSLASPIARAVFSNNSLCCCGVIFRNRFPGCSNGRRRRGGPNRRVALDRHWRLGKIRWVSTHRARSELLRDFGERYGVPQSVSESAVDRRIAHRSSIWGGTLTLDTRIEHRAVWDNQPNLRAANAGRATRRIGPRSTTTIGAPGNRSGR